MSYSLTTARTAVYERTSTYYSDTIRYRDSLVTCEQLDISFVERGIPSCHVLFVPDPFSKKLEPGCHRWERVSSKIHGPRREL